MTLGGLKRFTTPGVRSGPPCSWDKFRYALLTGPSDTEDFGPWQIGWEGNN